MQDDPMEARDKVVDSEVLVESCRYFSPEKSMHLEAEESDMFAATLESINSILNQYSSFNTADVARRNQTAMNIRNRLTTDESNQSPNQQNPSANSNLDVFDPVRRVIVSLPPKLFIKRSVQHQVNAGRTAHSSDVKLKRYSRSDN
jgi:Asp-tRNA(Asn)/Glu-tRNA(Gln) amidotransferase C subunit